MSSGKQSVGGVVKAEVKVTAVKYPFWFGGSASCFAACVTHPLDLVKVRLQTRSGNAPNTMVGTFVHVLKHNGFVGLYSGLSASLLRQITYSTTRFGIYEKLKTNLTSGSQPPSFPILIAMASTSGFIGGIVGNPADVLNVRMQHDAALPIEQRRNYKNAVDGLIRMTKEEGWKALYRGVWPNSMRAVLMTASQLASYDSFKQLLIRHTPMEDGLSTHFTASLMAGFVATTVCSPVDVIKTRIMSSHESKGLAKLLTDVYKVEGVGWMFRGWVPSFIRLGPQTIATFLFLEQHKKIYRSLKGIAEPEATIV
ncbi:similar to mitochondrial dicarboxylate carrier [Botrytis cinerea T4]|uniref:Similar to mitochondrial dicarboxylate carrier n=1 Tax=Botryotinia fuckeliana (strain T4) TaxID=999810 RepID=G2XVI8_BOTF4|nr:similar to mitochondrial dicarboxylate carrier [Botrytis cinerea T4]